MIDQATLKLKFESDAKAADDAIKTIGELKQVLSTLGNTKVGRDLQSTVKDLENTFKVLLASVNQTKKVLDAGVKSSGLKTAAKDADALTVALSKANAELNTYINKTAQMSRTRGGVGAAKSATDAVYGLGPILDARSNDPVTKRNLQAAIRNASEVVSERLQVPIKEAVALVKAEAMKPSTRRDIGKNFNAAANIIQARVVRTVTETANAERAFLNDMLARQNALRATFMQSYRGGIAPRLLLENKMEETLAWNLKQAEGYSRGRGVSARQFYSDRARSGPLLLENKMEETLAWNLRQAAGYNQERILRDQRKIQEELSRRLMPSVGFRGGVESNAQLSDIFRIAQKSGLKGLSPFEGISKSAGGLDEYYKRLNAFLMQITGEVAGVPKEVQKMAQAALRQLGPGGAGFQTAFRENLSFAMKKYGFGPGVMDTDHPSPYLTEKYNTSGVTTGIRYTQTDEMGNTHRKMWQGSEEAFLRYQRSVLNAPKVPEEKLAPPRSILGAWSNLKDSFVQVGHAGNNLYKQVEQPLTSIAIAVSRVAYGLRTVQFGLMTFGASFTAVIGGATVAAKNFASSILEVTEIQKKAEITLQGVFGDKGLAGDITKFAREYAIQTPATFREVTNMVKSFGFIPEIKRQILDVRGDAGALNKTLKDMAYTTIALGLTKPEQGIEGAMFSIREALAGQFRSLKMRFEIPMSAVAATVGMTETQLKDDPRKTMEALKNFMDINVGEDTIKKLYRNVSYQINNIIDVFEKAKVEIGQSGFEEAMEQMAFNVASSLENLLNTDKFKEQLRTVSSLMTTFGQKMFGYGKQIGWAILGGRPATSSEAITRANELRKSGELKTTRDYEDFIEIQDLVTASTAKLTVGYNALLKVLDAFIPRIGNMLSSLLGNQKAIDALVDNIIAFGSLLFDLADGMITIINTLVTKINSANIPNWTKALSLFFLAFPVATIQTILATGVAVGKFFGMFYTISSAGTIGKATQALSVFFSDLLNFSRAMTFGRAESGKLMASVGGTGIGGLMGFLLGDKKGVAPINKVTGAVSGTTEDAFLRGMSMTQAAATGAAASTTATVLSAFFRGGLWTGIVLAGGVLLEKITGVNIGFTSLAEWLGNKTVAVLRIFADALRSVVIAMVKASVYLSDMYKSVKSTLRLSDEKEVKQNRLRDLLTEKTGLEQISADIKSGKRANAAQLFGETTASINAKELLRVSSEIASLQKQGITPALTLEEQVKNAVDGFTSAIGDAKKPVVQVKTAVEQLEEASTSTLGTIKNITASMLDGMSVAGLQGLQNFNASGYGKVQESLDQFGKTEKFEELKKAQSELSAVINAPMNLVRDQFRAYESELKSQITNDMPEKMRGPVNSIFDGIASAIKSTNWYENVMFGVSKFGNAAKLTGLERYQGRAERKVQEAEEEAKSSIRLAKELKQQEIEIAEANGRTVEAKILRNRLEREQRQIQVEKEEKTTLTTLLEQTKDAQSAVDSAKFNLKKFEEMTPFSTRLVDIAKGSPIYNELIKNIKDAEAAQAGLNKEYQTTLDMYNKLRENKPKLDEAQERGFWKENLKSLESKFGINTENLVNPKAFADVEDFINRSKALVPYLSKIESQTLKKSEEAQNNLKSAILSDYEQLIDLLTTAYQAEHDAISARFEAIYSTVSGGFAALASDIMAAVDSFAASVSSALSGMNIVVNINAVINAATTMINGATGGLIDNLKAGIPTIAQGIKNWWGGLSKQRAIDTAPSESSLRNFRPGGGGGGGKGKKESLEERNRMLKEIADSEFVGDALRKTAFHGYTENEFKKKVEEIQKMQKEGILKQAEAEQYLSAITSERHRKELEFLRKMESERAKELTQYTEVFRAAENNPLISNQAEMTQAKMALSALEMADAYKDIEFKAFKAKESIKVMSDEILKQVGMTKEQATAYVDMASSAEKANYLLEMRKKNATGFEKGVLNLPSMKETFDKAQEDFVGQLASGLSEALASAIDPDSNMSLKESLSNLWKQLKKTVIKAFTDALANNLVRGLFGGMMGGGEQGGGGLFGGVSSMFKGEEAYDPFGGFGDLFGGGGDDYGFSDYADYDTELGDLLGLANGGIVSKPTLAIVGDNPISSEVVAPLHKLDSMMGKKSNQNEKPVQMNIVNVVDPQMVDKAIMNNPNTVINVVSADVASRGTIYKMIKSR